MSVWDVPAAARGAGIPHWWVILLAMPAGVGWRAQQRTVAARVFSAFAPLALHVAALRNGKGAIAAASKAPPEEAGPGAGAEAGLVAL